MAVRHSRNIARHITGRKLLNLIQNEIELRQKRTVLRSRPYFIKIEPTPVCHLRCPGCIRAESAANRYTMEDMLSLEGFCRIIDSLSNVLIGVSLSFLGEPLLNPDLMRMIAYCSERNIVCILDRGLSRSWQVVWTI
jgi:MoaA/NifB/PqqE/SkfB family radical SAM enzyme